MGNVLIPTAYSLLPDEWGRAVCLWALRFPSSPLLLSLNPGVSISFPIRMILLATPTDLAPCSPGLVHPYQVRAISPKWKAAHTPMSCIVTDLWLPVLCLLRKITLSRWKVSGGDGTGFPVWFQSLCCIFQRLLYLQVIRTACEWFREKWPNIEQKCVICLTFIQLWFLGFKCRVGSMSNSECRHKEQRQCACNHFRGDTLLPLSFPLNECERTWDSLAPSSLSSISWSSHFRT